MQAIDFCGKSVKNLCRYLTHAGKMVQNTLKVAKPPEKLFEISEMQRGRRTPSCRQASLRRWGIYQRFLFLWGRTPSCRQASLRRGEREEEEKKKKGAHLPAGRLH